MIIENVQRRATKLVLTCKISIIQRKAIQTGISQIRIWKRKGHANLHGIDQIDENKLLTPAAQYRATIGNSYKLHKKRSRLNVRANTFNNCVVDK